MSRSIIGLALTFAVGGVVWSSSVEAADVAGPRETMSASSVEHCGEVCGCWRTDYVRHRELLSTYGAGFDPNNYDFTEPHYYYGRERLYPRYSRDPG
ncbi:MAG: hypothetical protein ACLPGW_08550 [Roseiarcus sp.]